MHKILLICGVSVGLYACAPLDNQPQPTQPAEEVAVQVAAPIELEALIPASDQYAVLKTARGVVIRSDASGNFRVGRADLLPQSSIFIDEVAFILNEIVSTDKSILIAGHTDNIGSDAANTRLSLRRAQSVLKALSSRGVEASRMTAEGFGFHEPIADNGTKEGQALNRRVEVIILD